MNARKPKGKKTENGITIYVPMEYYERIALMKMRTGVPIKDLALQAVIEFLDRNKWGKNPHNVFYRSHYKVDTFSLQKCADFTTKVCRFHYKVVLFLCVSNW